ncbi:MAG: WD40 repeat domain-containing protein, partial [Verrucomicrobiota bacterium]|nr:WD40 repeat domain-containing protein [Verrucomicrobiota bacterium]
DPRQQAANEAKLSKEAVVKTEAAKTEAEGQKAGADKQQADADGAAKSAKDALSKPNASALAVVFSADSKRLITGSGDKIIHIWDTETGKQANSVSGHKGAVNGLGVTPSGHLISVSADKTAILWNLAREWKLERTLGSERVDSPIVDRATALSFSYDGRQLAVGSGEPSRSGTVHVFNVADGKVIKNLLEVHSDTVMGLQFNAEGTQIASGAADKFAKITNLADGKTLHSFEGHTHHVLGVAWQYNGRVLASVGADKEIKVWNVVTGERAGKVGVGGKEVTSIQFVGYTDNAVVTAGDNRVRRVSIPMGNPKNIRDFSGAKDYVYSGSISADGNIVAAGGADAVLRIWNGASGATIATFEAPGSEER